jgi:hypothetical protein
MNRRIKQPLTSEYHKVIARTKLLPCRNRERSPGQSEKRQQAGALHTLARLRYRVELSTWPCGSELKAHALSSPVGLKLNQNKTGELKAKNDEDRAREMKRVLPNWRY